MAPIKRVGYVSYGWTIFRRKSAACQSDTIRTIGYCQGLLDGSEFPPEVLRQVKKFLRKILIIAPAVLALVWVRWIA